MSSIKKRICDALSVSASADENSVQTQTLRLVKTAIEDRDMRARARGECNGCDEDEVLELLEKMVAQRKVSTEEFDADGRIAEADREREEIEIISKFLPRPLEGDELEAAVRAVVAELDAKRLTDVGRCMTALRTRFPGQVKCGSAGKAVRAALS